MLPSYLLESREKLEAVCRELAHATAFGCGRVLCRVLGEFPCFVNPSDNTLAPRLALDGYWESWVTLALARVLRPGMHCVDVGACYGYYSLLMAQGVGPTGKVLACEPNPATLQKFLEPTLEANGFHSSVGPIGNVVSEWALVTNQDGDAFLTIPVAKPGGSVRSVDPKPGDVSVRGVTLDLLCADWPRVDLVKVDVEGTEDEVWDGAAELRRKHPRCQFWIELHAHCDLRRSLAFLRRLLADVRPVHYVEYDGTLRPASVEAVENEPLRHWELVVG